MTIIVVPGMEGSSHEWVLDDRRTEGLGTGAVGGSGKLEYWEVDTWSHGWPLEYLRRPYVFDSGPLGSTSGSIVEWATLRAWRMWGKVYAFSCLNLVIDLLIAFSIIFGIVSACELWRRRRSGFRFSLLDVAVVATVLSAVLGWWQYHVHLQLRETAAVSSLEGREVSKDSRQPRVNAVQDYTGPAWLRRLVGSCLPSLWHVTLLELDVAKLTPDDYSDIEKLTATETVNVAGRLNSELVSSLASLPHLTTLHGQFDGFVRYPSTRKWESLATSAELPLLGRLPHLQQLRLGECKIDSAGMACLATLPKLESLQIRGCEILIEDLEPLASSRSLTSIEIDICATREELAIFAMKHSSLDIHLPKFGEDAPHTASPREVAEVLFERWRKEDRAILTEAAKDNPVTQDGNLPPDEAIQQESPSSLASGGGGLYPSGGNHNDESITEVDLSGIRLTRKRLERIPTIVLAGIDNVTFGKVDSAATALELLHRCGTLTHLDARQIPLTRSEVDTIKLQPGCSLCLQQGPLGVADVCDLLKRWQPDLAIFESSFSPDDVREIEIAGNGLSFSVYVYSGFVEEEDQTIESATLPSDGVNPFAE